MDSHEYKQICALPNVLPRRVLEETKIILDKANLAEVKIVEDSLARGAIAFPEHYDGDPESSYHKIICSEVEAGRIADYLFEKEAESVPTSGIGTSQTSRLVMLVNIWHELADSV